MPVWFTSNKKEFKKDLIQKQVKIFFYIAEIHFDEVFGKMIQNVVPFPFTDSTFKSPCIWIASFFAIDNPNP